MMNNTFLSSSSSCRCRSRPRRTLLYYKSHRLQLLPAAVVLSLVVLMKQTMTTMTCSAFVTSPPLPTPHFTTTSLQRAVTITAAITTTRRSRLSMITDPFLTTATVATTTTATTVDAAAVPDNLMMNAVADAAALLSSSSSIQLATTEAWVEPLSLIMDPILNFLSFAMLARVVLSWYPSIKGTDFPYALVVYPTEALLRAAKGFIPPAFGVDITPVFWLAIFTFIHEILLGQQGLLTMKIKYGI